MVDAIRERIKKEETHYHSQQGACNKQINEVASKLPGDTGAYVTEIKALNCIEKYHWCSIIYNTFPKH